MHTKVRFVVALFAIRAASDDIVSCLRTLVLSDVALMAISVNGWGNL